MGIATAFVGPTFTLAELRAVYEAVWGVHLDGANTPRGASSRRAAGSSRPGAELGPARPAELYRAGRMWKHGSPIRYPQPTEKGKGNQ
jgi:8-oxo-dGTP diphosphatase